MLTFIAFISSGILFAADGEHAPAEMRTKFFMAGMHEREVMFLQTGDAPIIVNLEGFGAVTTNVCAELLAATGVTDYSVKGLRYGNRLFIAPEFYLNNASLDFGYVTGKSTGRSFKLYASPLHSDQLVDRQFPALGIKISGPLIAHALSFNHGYVSASGSNLRPPTSVTIYGKLQADHSFAANEVLLETYRIQHADGAEYPGGFALVRGEILKTRGGFKIKSFTDRVYDLDSRQIANTDLNKFVHRTVILHGQFYGGKIQLESTWLLQIQP